MRGLNILVLGGSGFVGAEVIKKLSVKYPEANITALQHHRKIDTSNANVKIVKRNIGSLNMDQVRKLNPDLVFHLARNNSNHLKHIGRFIAGYRGRIQNQRLLHHLNQLQKPISLVYLSGSLIYGKGIHNEQATLNPISFSKQYHLAELPFLNHHIYKNLSLTTVRCPWILGNGSWFKTFYLDHIKSSNTIYQYSPSDFKMMFIDVKDCAENLVRIASLNHKGCVNLFMPDAITYSEFINLIQSQFPSAKLVNISHNMNFEKALHEAFHTEILLSSIYPDIQSKLNYSKATVREMITDNLLDFAHHI